MLPVGIVLQGELCLDGGKVGAQCEGKAGDACERRRRGAADILVPQQVQCLHGCQASGGDALQEADEPDDPGLGRRRHTGIQRRERRERVEPGELAQPHKLEDTEAQRVRKPTVTKQHADVGECKVEG